MGPTDRRRSPDGMTPAGLRVSRRTFLEGGAALAGLASLAGCSKGGNGSDGTGGSRAGGGSSNLRGDRLAELRSVLRAAPDHLVARARAAVKARDDDALVALVQEKVAILPSPADTLTGARWGHDAALRGGAGTLRERADLLAALLTEAGATATVVAIDRPAAVDARALRSTPVPTFDPDHDRLASLWRGVFPGAAPWPGAVPDRLGQAVDREADRLLAVLSAEDRKITPDAADLPTQIPAVEVRRGGSTRWAVAVGPVGWLTRKPSGLSTAVGDTALPDVSLTVSVALVPPRGVPAPDQVIQDVARATWSAAEVAGRSVELTFVPPAGPAEVIGQSPDAFPNRIPLLRLVSAEGGAPRADAIGETLAMVSTAGARYELNETDDGLVGPYGPLPSGSPAERHQARTTVASLTATVDASTFPAVEVGVSALDGSKQPVDGLGAADLEVREDGKPVPFDVVANGAPGGVRLLVVYDTSGSVADSWKTPEAKAAFESALAGSLTTAAASSSFTVQVIGVGDRASEDGWITPDQAAIAAALGGVVSDSSVWATVGGAVPASGASAAILVSDNVSALELPEAVPGYQRALRSAGVPVLCVPIGAADQAATAEIVRLSGGAVLQPGAPDVADRLRSFAEAQVTKAATTSYRLRLHAPEQGAAKRTVTVAVVDSSARAAEATYEVPAAADRGLASGLAGVYLTITVGERTEVRRLGGMPPDGRGGIKGEIDATAVAQATAVLDQVHAVAFEPGSPPASVLLDDALGAALTAARAAAVVKSSLDATDLAELGDRVNRAGRYATLLPALLQPPAGGPAAPPEGLRVVVVSVGADAKGRLVTTTDIVPGLNRCRPVGTDGPAAFGAALRGSLALSLREGATLSTSAAADLAGRPLRRLGPNDSLADDGPWSAEHRAALTPVVDEYFGWLRLVPETGSGPACWVIDPATGSAFAVGALGHGHGSAAKDCFIDWHAPVDLAGALFWLGVAGAAVSVRCAVSDLPTATTAEKIACIGAQTAGVASTVGALFTASSWSAAAVTYFVYAISNLMGAIPSIVESGSPVDGAGKVVLAVISLLIGMLGNISCS